MNGQERRAWLEDLIARYVVPAVPPEMRGQVSAVNSAMNPVQQIGDSMAAGRRMAQTGLSMPQRVEAAGNMLSGVAGVVAPAVASARMGGQAANALAEGLAGMTAPQRNALADFGADEFGGITLWHGSPHDFDRFDMSKIGTGEGAQAYGHGLYFAESPGVARSYRDKLSGGGMLGKAVEQAIRQYPQTNSILAEQFAVAIQNMFDDGKTVMQVIKSAPRGFAEEWAAGVKAYKANAGRLYQVDVAADPADFLDWDKPLIEQPAKVQSGLRSYLDPRYGQGFFDQYAANEVGMRDVYDNFDDLTAPEMTNELVKQGIPGIKYLDAGSRRAGDGSRNYVVFDDRLITILKKYGALPAAFGGALAASPDQAQAGGVALTGEPPQPGRLSFGQIAGSPGVASGPVGPLAAMSHGTNALARFLYDQMPEMPGPMTPPQPVQKPDGSWGW